MDEQKTKIQTSVSLLLEWIMYQITPLSILRCVDTFWARNLFEFEIISFVLFMWLLSNELTISFISHPLSSVKFITIDLLALF